jgi:hypothetical protein
MKRLFLVLTAVLSAALMVSTMRCVSPSSNSNRKAACDGDVPGYFDVTFPAIGDSVKMGSLDTIRWSNLKSPPDTAVSLYLLFGNTVVDTISARTANSGAVAWKIPFLATGDAYRIKLCGLKDTARHNLGCPFRIYSGYVGIISVISPAAGAACTTGRSQRIRWESVGKTGDSVSIRLLDDSIPVRTIAEKVRNGDTLTWKIPSGIPEKKTYRIKVASSFDLGISGRSDFFSIIEAVKDKFEPDNNMDSASTLDTLGKTQDHSLSGNDIDWIKFSADSGKSYMIKLTGDSGIGIAVYSKDSTLLKMLTPNGGKTAADSLFQWTSPKSGDYFLKITSPGDSPANYKIGMAQQQQAKGVTFIVPNATSVWSVGNSYSIKWLPDSAYLGNKVNIILFKGARQLQAVQSAYPNSGDVSFLVDLKLESGQDYRIRIVNGSDTAKGGFSDNFSVKGCEPDPFEPDNKRENASKATTDGKAQNRTFTVNDTDWIAFDVENGRMYQMVFSGGAAASIRLFSGASSQPAADTAWESLGSGTGSLKWKCPGGGTWYARVVFSLGPSGAGCGPYSFTVSDITVNTGIAPDAYEPDNVRGSASVLSPLGKAQAHTLTVNDTDWVQFSLESGSRYTIRSTGAIAMGVSIYSGTDAAPTTYFYNSIKGSALSLLCPKSGAWYARIAAQSNIESGSYSFNVSKFDTVNAVLFSSPAQGQTITTGSTCQIKWTADSAYLGTNVNLSIVKGTARLANIATNINNNGAYSWDVPSYLSSGTNYRVKIENCAQTDLNGYSPLFTINATTLDVYEPNNHQDSATPYSPLGKPQTHNLTPNDTDWIVFSADTGKVYVVECRSTVPVWGQIYNQYSSYSSGSFRTMVTDVPTTSQFMSRQGGDCYIRVCAYNLMPFIGGTTQVGTYTITISPMDSVSSTISVTSPGAGTAWSAGMEIPIQWSAADVTGSVVYLQLYKGNNSVYSVTSSQNTGAYSWILPEGFATGSDYRIRVGGTGGMIFPSYTPGSFGFSPVFTINGVKPDAYEPDDTVSLAVPITVDGAAQPHSLSMGDADWLRFTAQKDSTYAIETITKGSGTTTIMRSIYEIVGSDLMYVFGDYMIGSQKFIWTCPKSGTYYLNLTNTGMPSGGDYTVSITSFSFATSAKFLNPTDASVWQAGSSYLIQWVADTTVFGSSIGLQLYRDTTMAMDIGGTFNTGMFSLTLPAGMASSAKYTIRLLSQITPATFKASPVFTINGIAADAYEPDDYFESARKFSVKTGSESHTLHYMDQDWFTFPAEAERLYVVKTTGDTRSMATVIQLNNADWNLIGSAYSTTADSSATLFMPAEYSDTYSFSVTSSTTGGYSVTLASYDSTQYGLKVTSPSSGGSLAMEQPDTIRWSSAVTPGGNVDISLYSGSGFVLEIGAAAARDGQYVWTPPATLTAGKDYSIEIVSRFSPMISGRSGKFSIKK